MSSANAGVYDLCGLYIMLLTHPENTVEGLLGERIKVDEIIVRRDDHDIDGFESCSVRELVKPKDEE